MATTRSRVAAGSTRCAESCGPSSLITVMWIWFLRSANGSFSCAACASAWPGGSCCQSLVEFHLGLLSCEAREDSSCASRAEGVTTVRWRHGAGVEVGKRAERLRGLRLRLGEHDRHAFVDGARDLAVARDEDVRLAAEDGDDVALADADAAVRAVEDEAGSSRCRTPSGRASRGPSFVFLSESESSIPTITRSVEASIVAITSGVKPGGVSTTM